MEFKALVSNPAPQKQSRENAAELPVLCTFPFPIGADVNECESEDHPCDQETEDCENVQGSFKCTCKAGMERSEESTCVPALKAKKKKKSKKSTQKQKSSVGTSSPPASLADAEAPAGEDDHRVPPWYSTLVPLVVCAFVYKHCKPTISTSISLLTVGLLVFFVI